MNRLVSQRTLAPCHLEGMAWHGMAPGEKKGLLFSSTRGPSKGEQDGNMMISSMAIPGT